MPKTTRNNELEQMLNEAVEALKAPSKILENIPNMSKIEIKREIDKRISLITEGKLKPEEMEQVKAEARTLAIVSLRKY